MKGEDYILTYEDGREEKYAIRDWDWQAHFLPGWEPPKAKQKEVGRTG